MKWRQAFRYLHILGSKIVLLQETHFAEQKQRRIRNEWGGIIFFDNSSEARRVANMFDRALDIKINKIEKSREHRYLIMEVQVNGTDMLLVNIYVPNKDDPKFFLVIWENLESEMGPKLRL